MIRRLLPFFDLGIAVGAAALIACTYAPEECAIPRSRLDGNQPIALYLTDKARSGMAMDGESPGGRLRMLDRALPEVSRLWNPTAAGAPQPVPVDWDDASDGPCITGRLSMWSPPLGAAPAIYICPAWIYCTVERENAANELHGYAGCRLHILHELLHNLGANDCIGGGHIEQNGRPRYGSGPVLCGWSSGCQDPKLIGPTLEDVAKVCTLGGHGGRCP